MGRIAKGAKATTSTKSVKTTKVSKFTKTLKSTKTVSEKQGAGLPQIVKVSDMVEQKLTSGRPIATLLEYVDTIRRTYGVDTKITLDFLGVSISETIAYDDKFKQLLLDDRYQNVILMFHGEREVPRVCKLLLRISNKDENRIVDVPITHLNLSPQESLFMATDKSDRLKRKILNLGSEVDKENNLITVYYHHNKDGDTIFETLTSQDSIVAVRDAILELGKQSNIKNVCIDFTGIELVVDRAETLLETLCLMIRNLAENGYHVEISSDNDKDVRYISMIDEIPNMPRDINKIIEILDANLELNAVGLLSEYVNKPNKLDNFGHYGNGEVATRQVAIYLGRDDYTLKFKVFDARYFKRKIDKKILNNAVATSKFQQLQMSQQGLTSHTVNIPITQIGVCKFCDGPQYYFSLPVQENASEFVETHYRSSQGKFETIRILLPTFISMVLNENNEDYNLDLLMECEEESIRRLTKKNIFIPDVSDIDFGVD